MRERLLQLWLAPSWPFHSRHRNGGAEDDINHCFSELKAVFAVLASFLSWLDTLGFCGVFACSQGAAARRSTADAAPCRRGFERALHGSSRLRLVSHSLHSGVQFEAVMPLQGILKQSSPKSRPDPKGDHGSRARGPRNS